MKARSLILFIIVAGCFCAVAGCGSGDGSGPDQPVASVLQTFKEVEHKKAAAMNWQKAERGTTMDSLDRLRTGQSAKAVLLFVENIRTTLGPQSLLVVKDGPGEKKEQGMSVPDVVLKIAQGLCLFEIPDEKGTSLMVETPYAIITHRGTVFVTEVADDGSTRVVVKNGSVDVSAAGSTVICGPSQATVIKKGAVPGTPEIVNLAQEPGFTLDEKDLPSVKRRKSF